MARADRVPVPRPRGHLDAAAVVGRAHAGADCADSCPASTTSPASAGTAPRPCTHGREHAARVRRAQRGARRSRIWWPSIRPSCCRRRSATRCARRSPTDRATPSSRGVGPAGAVPRAGRPPTSRSSTPRQRRGADHDHQRLVRLGVTVAGAGFLLNNEMDDFAAQAGHAEQYGLVQGEANAIAPGKRMLSSMTPTIVLDTDRHPMLVTGASGGPVHHHHGLPGDLEPARLRPGRRRR